MKRKFVYIILLVFCVTAKLTAQTNSDSVYTMVEKMPEFPGGEMYLMKYLSASIEYPSCYLPRTTNDKVYVEFIVSKTGKIYDAKIIRSAGKELDKIILRVINNMPDWSPGVHHGNYVNVRMRLPIGFEFF